MAYNSKYTGAQVEALLDRAGAAPQTYDIGWLMNLISTSENDTVTLAAEQFNEVKAAANAGKIFITSELVFSYDAGDNPGVVSYIILTAVRNKSVLNLSVLSQNGTYGAGLRTEQIVMQDDLTGYAKASDVPKKTSQLTNDSGFLTEHQSLDGYARKREVVKALPNTIGYGTSNAAMTPTIELAADKFYIIGRSFGLAITLPAGSDTDGKEYVCQFYVGSNYGSYTLTLPDTVAWLNGEAPTFESTTCYMLSIVNNCAVIGMFKQAS